MDVSCVVQAVHVVCGIAGVEHAVAAADVVLHPLVWSILVVLHEIC